MLKNKKVVVLSLLVIVVAMGVVLVYTGTLNTALRFFNKPINSAEDVQNAPGIVEMTETSPSYGMIHSVNRYIAEGRNQWPYANDAICYELKYKSNQYIVQGFLALPDDYLEKEYPVLIYNRGGWNVISSISSGHINIDQLYSLARAGFIVLATQHRGWDWGLTKDGGKDEFGGGDVQDVIALVDLAEKFTFTNGKTYMFGWSRGATMTYIVLSRDDRITAAVAGAGPTDLLKAYDEGEDLLKTTLIELIGGTPEQLPYEYKKRSAVFWPDKINTPLFIAHGTEDLNVQVHHSADLYDKMKALGKDVELQLYEGEDHGTAYSNYMETYLHWLLAH